MTYPLRCGRAPVETDPAHDDGDAPSVAAAPAPLGASAGRVTFRGAGTARVREARYAYGIELGSRDDTGPYMGAAFLEPVPRSGRGRRRFSRS